MSNQVTEVSIKKEGTGKKGPWKMFQAVLDDGRKATGFDQVHVGDWVEVTQDGQYLNYKKVDKPQNGPANAPQSPQQSFNGATLDQRQRAIIRQHSQSMALEVLKLKVGLNELTVEDLTPAKLRALADYFDQDVMKAAE